MREEDPGMLDASSDAASGVLPLLPAVVDRAWVRLGTFMLLPASATRMDCDPPSTAFGLDPIPVLVPKSMAHWFGRCCAPEAPPHRPEGPTRCLSLTPLDSTDEDVEPFDGREVPMSVPVVTGSSCEDPTLVIVSIFSSRLSDFFLIRLAARRSGIGDWVLRAATFPGDRSGFVALEVDTAPCMSPGAPRPFAIYPPGGGPWSTSCTMSDSLPLPLVLPLPPYL